jgi:4-amino-4-deoxy-L-arabinose transferase-like glycosyltransferase
MEARERWIAGAIVAVAVALRLGHLIGASQALLFHNPIIDERATVDEALKIASGGSSAGWAFWKPPLYSYFLAGLFALGGEADLWLPRLAQVLLDGATVWLTWRVARRVVAPRLALAAAAIVALHGTLIYFTGELTSATLGTFLCIASVAALLAAADRPAWWTFLLAGLVLGLATLTRAETLLVAPFAAAFAAARTPGPRLLRAASAGALLAGLAVAMSPVTLHNYRAHGEVVAVSSNGGINFYIGTMPRYRGVIGARPGPEWEELARIPQMFGARNDVEISAYWSARARAHIAGDPAGYALHVLRKLGHFAHGYELASNHDVYRARRTSPVGVALLWTTPVLQFPAGLIMPLALIGIVVARRRRGVPLILAFLGVQVATAAVFFVTARFRAPVIPLLAVLAVAGGAWLWERRRNWRPLVVAAALLVVLNLRVVLDADRAAYRTRLRAEEHYFRGVALFINYDDRYLTALAELRRARALAPHAAIWLNEAKVLLLLSRWEEAFDALLEGAALADDDPGQKHLLRDYYNLMWELGRAIAGNPGALSPDRRELLEAHGCWRWHDWPCAEPHFAAALAAAPVGSRLRALAEAEVARAHIEMAQDMLAQLRYERAARAARRALELREQAPMAHLVLGYLAFRGGRLDEARTELARFRALERPPGAFFHEASHPDNVSVGRLGFAIVDAYAELFSDDPEVRRTAAQVGALRRAEAERRERAGRKLPAGTYY